jgi:G3E family GTPase
MDRANQEEAEEPLPLSVLTGFLGSGKTTLLSHLLRSPELKDVAVLINEFGEVGLDHHLLRKLDETTVLLDSGCLCCTVRDDLVTALRELFWKRRNGEIPRFTRVVIETTGLADPAPIIHTLMRDPLCQHVYRLDGVIATVDAVVGGDTLDRHREAVKQAAMADRLVLTKTDLASAEAVEALRRRLRALNPAAPILASRHGVIDAAVLFDAGLYDPKTKTLDAQRWLNAEAYATPDHDHDDHHDHDQEHDHGHGHDHHGHPDVNRHDDHIRAFCLLYDKPLVWDRFAAWVETIVLAHGPNLLRMKGLLNVLGEERPVAVHGVQHLFHPPVQLDAWPDADRRSRIVLIVRDVERAFFERTLASFNEGPDALAPAGA